MQYSFTVNYLGQTNSVLMSIWDTEDLIASNPNDKHVAQLFSLVEEYFPTQKLRCTLGTSTSYNHGCLQFDQKLKSINNTAQ